MAKQKFKTGDRIEINSECGYLWFRGCISEDEARKLVAQYEESRLDDGRGAVNFLSLNAVCYYARFGFGINEQGNSVRHLYTHRPKGERGSFLVTQVEYSIDIWD